MTNQVRLGKQKWTVKISISVAQDKGRKIITLLARSKLPPARTRIHLGCPIFKKKNNGLRDDLFRRSKKCRGLELSDDRRDEQDMGMNNRALLTRMQRLKNCIPVHSFQDRALGGLYQCQNRLEFMSNRMARSQVPALPVVLNGHCRQTR